MLSMEGGGTALAVFSFCRRVAAIKDHFSHPLPLSQDTIVVAVVVPVGIVLLTALVAAVVLTRRRRARAAAYASSAPGKANGASNSGSQAVAGVLPSAARSSDIFMGFEPDAAPPVWTQQHDEEVRGCGCTQTECDPWTRP